MSCKVTTCCDRDDLAFKSSNATDADNAVKGPSNPNCPTNYLWGGLSCVRVVSPQTCSPGYFWNGAACVLGTTVICLPGYFVSSGVCVPCTVPPVCTLIMAHNQITVNFDVAIGLPYRLYRSLDGVTYSIRTSGTGGAGTESYVDVVVAGTTYFYFLSVQQSVECGYIDGLVCSVVAI